MPRTIALVACVKSKQATARPVPAAELYTSPLFKGTRRYAEARADAWLILSAEHGLVAPDTPLLPYEKFMGDMRKKERAAWGEAVLRQLSDQLQPGDEIVVMAGAHYREHLVPALEQRGYRVTVPMQGLGLLQQLAWLKANNR